MAEGGEDQKHGETWNGINIKYNFGCAPGPSQCKMLHLFRIDNPAYAKTVRVQDP
jgi:hypothetical protein